MASSNKARRHQPRVSESPTELNLTLPSGYELDDYRITELLGKGGFGITYKGEDVNLRRAVAIKEYLPSAYAYRDANNVVKPRSDEDAQLFEWGLTRFVDEARALAMFRHPNIVSVIRFLEANGTAYLIMDYEKGADLKQFLAKHTSPMSEQTLVQKILLPVLDGLEKVHEQGLLHRDIKPDNIFIREDGTPALIDFGAARPHGAAAAKTMTSIISSGFSPFEQYGAGEGNTSQGPWSDLYALAGTLYWIVAGAAPLDAIARHQGRQLIPAAEAAQPGYSENLLAAIDCALDLDIQKRPQNVAEFRALLGGGDPPVAGPDDATQVRLEPESTSASTRSKLVPGLLAVLAAVGIGVGGWWYVSQTDGDAAVLETPVASEAAETENLQTSSEAVGVDIQPDPSIEVAEEAAPAEPAPPDEDDILAELEAPPQVIAFREEQITGQLMAYVTNKNSFDACMQSNCAEQMALMTRLQAAQEVYEWNQSGLGFSGTIRVANPRALSSDTCPLLLDLHETVQSIERECREVRTYCTSNGLDRVLQSTAGVQC